METILRLTQNHGVYVTAKVDGFAANAYLGRVRSNRSEVGFNAVIHNVLRIPVQPPVTTVQILSQAGIFHCIDKQFTR